MRVSRDEIGIILATDWSLRGTCARRKVGCVLFDEHGRQIGSGYNGPASGQPHCIDAPCGGAGFDQGQGLAECEAIHAEQNALLQCADVLKIHTCYTTASPCMHCLKLLLNTSCRRIVFSSIYKSDHDAAKALWTRDPIVSNHGVFYYREWIHLDGVK